MPVDTVEGILFKWVTEAAETDIYHKWQHSIVYIQYVSVCVQIFPIVPLSFRYSFEKIVCVRDCVCVCIL